MVLAPAMDVVGGLVLITGVLPLVPAVGKSIAKYTKAMAAYQVPIGIISIILGIVDLGNLVPAIIAILVGIFLAISVVGAIPKLGPTMLKVAKAIGSVQVIFGIIALIVGIWYLL